MSSPASSPGSVPHHASTLDDLFGSDVDDGVAPSTGAIPPATPPMVSATADEPHDGGDSDSDEFDLGTTASRAGNPPEQTVGDGLDNVQDLDDLFGDEPEDGDNRQPSRSPRSPMHDDREKVGEEIGNDDEDMEGLFGGDAFDEASDQDTKLPPWEATITDKPLGFRDGSEHYIAKIPAFLHVEPEEFSPDTYQEEASDPTSNLTDLSSLKLKVQNTIRWRQAEGQGLESNARFVRWSDGTMSLVVGNEYFDAVLKPTNPQQHILTTHHPDANLLQGCCTVSQSVTFRPSSTASLTHKNFTMSIADRHRKTTKAKLYHTTYDPEKAKREMEIRENERLKAQKRLEASRQRKAMRLSSNLTEAALEAEEESDRGYGGNYGRSAPRGSYLRRDFRDEGAEEEYDDDFVVADEEEEFAEGYESEDNTWERKREREPQDDDSDAERERRILEAKRRGMESYREESKDRVSRDKSVPAGGPILSDEELADDSRDAAGSQRRSVKRRAVVWSDEEEGE
ncbi:Paf1 complex component [Dispira parvispora]|uniref:Paf1 complex component n=1 Tax=Dispira parvispora TaxID=1520584 RepID=A0A9W8API4_9FUNG|nr:Paf1 complex component [Dispira parvispora]